MQRASLTDASVPIVALRAVVLVLGVVAELWNIVVMVRGGESPTHHFGYFTIQASIAAIVLVAALLLVPAVARPRWFESLRGAITGYLVLAMLVWALLVAEPHEAFSWTIPFPGIAQHRIIPVLLLIDWILVPPRTALPFWRTLGAWMLYPVLFLVGSWLRGGLSDGWYPYGFLDPSEHDGPLALVLSVARVLGAFLVVLSLVLLVGRWRSGRRDSIASSTSARPTSNSSP